MSGRLAWLQFEAGLFGHDPLEWFVLTGDRRLVSGVQLLVLGGVFAAVVASGLVPLRQETPVLFLLFALIAANFTLIAIVTSLSQFVLSRRLESPGEIREKMAETVAYRVDVAETTGGAVLPVKLDAFFLTLFESVREQLDDLDANLMEGRTRRTREEVNELVTGLTTHVDYIVALLEHPSSAMKHALFTALNTEYESHVHRAWYLQAEYDEELSPALVAPLRRLTETLEHVVVATRLFEAAFIESEVSELSRYLLYVGLPVQIAAVVVMLLYTTPDATPLVPHPVVSVVVPAVLTAGFAPFLILGSYIVRLTVVARRTADNFPFSSQLKKTLALDDINDHER